MKKELICRRSKEAFRNEVAINPSHEEKIDRRRLFSLYRSSSAFERGIIDFGSPRVSKDVPHGMFF